MSGSRKPKSTARTKQPAGQAARPRDATATRAAILTAAREAFTRERYDRVGVREIAAAAGVDPALVIRYFGGKEALYVEALHAKFEYGEMLAGDRATLGLRLAHSVFDKPAHLEGFDPLVALLRSLGDETSGRLLREGIQSNFARQLAARLDEPNREERAGLIVGAMLGVLVSRFLMRLPSLEPTGATRDALIAAFGGALQTLIDGDTD